MGKAELLGKGSQTASLHRDSTGRGEQGGNSTVLMWLTVTSQDCTVYAVPACRLVMLFSTAGHLAQLRASGTRGPHPFSPSGVSLCMWCGLTHTGANSRSQPKQFHQAPAAHTQVRSPRQAAVLRLG